MVLLVREVSRILNMSPGLGGWYLLLGNEGTLGAGNGWLDAAPCLWLMSLRECASGVRDSLEK